ncbi:MAG: transglutaminase domain-containing protein [Ginsengibacter sp.]
MRLLLILVCFIIYTLPINAQIGKIERIALNIPDSETNTTDDIAAYIKSHFNTDDEKIRAIYTWVTYNIKYDKTSVHRIILDEDQEQRVTYALKSRRGVCENFAAIFNDICQKSGIPSFYIEGYTKQNGSVDRTGHVWCAAFVDNTWALYDPTWDVGYLSGGNYVNQVGASYFKNSPGDFILSHLPFDPMFQFLDYQVSYKEFYNGSRPTNNPKSYFNYKDSLSVYYHSDSLSRYLASFHRIENFDWPSSKIDTKLKRQKLEIELIYQDRDMNDYHSAIADYNTGIDLLNEFINYRNNQFQPTKKMDEVPKMFNTISKKIAAANQKLVEVNQSKATLTLNTGDIQQKLNDLALYVKEQQNFYRNHLSSSK